MATIGTITRTENGEFTGTVRTLNISTPIKLLPLGNERSERSPSHRVLTANGFEIGAAWGRLREVARSYPKRATGIRR